MQPASDIALLEEFKRSRSEHAFRVLVERHLDHVHSVAQRVTRNHTLAADISQQIFALLATDTQKIPDDVPLAAWLHVKTRSMAVDMVRSEQARTRREREFQLAIVMHQQDKADWSQLEPLIDEVVGDLPKADRDAILWRFYQKQTLARVGEALGTTEDAARMRINRALEKLRAQLAKRGIATTTSALALILPANAVTAAPPALAASITTSVVGASAGASTATATVTGVSAWTSFAKVCAFLAAIALTVIPLVSHLLDDRQKLIAEIQTLRQNPAEVSQERPPALTIEDSMTVHMHSQMPGTPSLREIMAQTDPAIRTRSLLRYVRALAPSEIPEALRQIRMLSSTWDPEAGMLVHVMLVRWAQEAPEAAFAALEILDLRNLKADGSSIVSGLAAQDPDRLAAWLARPDNALVHFPQMGHILAGTIAREWVRLDRDAALQWAHDLPDSQRLGAYAGLLGHLASSAPEMASTLAMHLPADDTRSYLAGEIAAAWARQAPGDAITWAHSLHGADRRSGMTNALTSWADMAPESAASYIDQISRIENIQPYAEPIAGSWAARAPAQAADWVASLPEGSGKNEAMNTLMWHWTNRSPESSSAWLARQPVSDSRDQGITGLARAAFDTEPASALTWAVEISNNELRARSLEIGLSEWLRRDALAAGEWAERNHIPIPTIPPLPTNLLPPLPE